MAEREIPSGRRIAYNGAAMEETESWKQQMQAAIEGLRAELETRDLPRLRKAVAVYKSTYDNVYQLLVRKSMIKEDLYGYDSGTQRLEVPTDEPILESQKMEQAGMRLAAYTAQLNLLSTSMQTTLEWLTLSRLGPLAGLAQYVKWAHLTQGSESPITQCVAEFIDRIKAHSDLMASRVAATNVSQMGRLSREIVQTVEKVAAYQREAYKAMLRRDVMPAVGADGTEEERLARAKKVFAGSLKGKAFYPELLKEVLAEDSPAGDGARAAALRRISIRDEKPEQAPAAADRVTLMQAVRAMAAAASPLADCAVKLAAMDQSARREREPRGLRALLRRLRHVKPEPPTCRIEYLDGAVMRSETIAMDAFLDEVTKQSRLLAALTRRDGPTGERLRRAGDRTLAEFVDRQLATLQIMHRRLAGLSDLFRKQAPPASAGGQEGPVKGIKIELTVLHNCLIRSNRLRHAYAGTEKGAAGA
jgi:hypothetical protein